MRIRRDTARTIRRALPHRILKQWNEQVKKTDKKESVGNDRARHLPHSSNFHYTSIQS